MGKKEYSDQRRRMVELLIHRGIRDRNVLQAMEIVRRHSYFTGDLPHGIDPYGDYPCAIGFGQTISQPYIVAYMLEKLQLKRGCRVLEIGTGSGYQASVLFEMGMDVYTIEMVAELYEHSRSLLDPSIKIKHGDGYAGWRERAPFQAIVLSCAPGEIPSKLVDQLEEQGRMILPVGDVFQRLVIVEKHGGTVKVQNDLPVRFVPMLKPAH